MIYADTSVIVALLTLEPSTSRILAWFAEISETLVSSDWLLTEFSSAISIKRRTGKLSESHAARVREEFELMVGNGLRILPVSRDAFRLAAELVERHESGLRAGDSLHLGVALELGASHLATLDITLAANASANGFELVAF